MKKLFGVMCLFFCVLLASCNMGLLSDRSGSIDFSIPTKDIIDAANNYAARNGGDDSSDKFIFLVQIKGSRNYYDSIIQSVTVPKGDAQTPVQEGELILSEKYLKGNNVNFSFKGVPAGQAYKVMFNMFLKEKDDTCSYLLFAGRADNVKVPAGKTVEAQIKAKTLDNSILTLVIEYQNGTKDTVNLLTHWGIKELQNDAGGQQQLMEDPYVLSLDKEYGRLKKMGDSIKDIYFTIDPNSNITDSSFNFSIPYDDPKAPNTTKYYNLKFHNNVCSIKDFLLKTVKMQPPAKPSGSDYIYTRSGVLISKGNLLFCEPSSEFKILSSDEVISGKIDKQQLNFQKKSYNGSEQVLISLTHVPDLLSDFSDGRSGAILLKMKGDNEISKNTELYYNFFTSHVIEGLTGEDLFSGSSCINHKNGEKQFIIPLNGISSNKAYLAIFVKSNAEVFDATFEMDYVIFPSLYNFYVFGVGQAYDSEGKPTGGYRYETNIPLDSSLQGGANYKAQLKGYVCSLSLSDGYFSKKSITLNGELYNSSNEESFYPLSNGNPPSFQTYTGQDETINEFIFSNIREPKLNADRYFMCTAPCEDVNTLLVVKNYSFECNDF